MVCLEAVGDIAPESWAVTAGCDSRECWPEFPHYVSAYMGDSPLFDAAEAIPRCRGGDKLPDQLDGRPEVRRSTHWAIDVEAAAFVRARTEGASYIAPVPAPQGRARRDLAENVAWELSSLPLVVDTDAVLAVCHPYPAFYHPAHRRRA